MIDSWSQIREKIIGIGSMERLTKFATSVEVPDLKTAAYMFFSYVWGIMRSADASDPRDKIFAAFSFLQQVLKPHGVPPRLQPSFLKSDEDIYNDIGIMFLKILPDFAISSEVQYLYHRGFNGLATWIPDYSLRRYESLYDRDNHTRYNAGGPPTARVRPDAELYTMTTESRKPILTLHECHILDRISHIEERPPPGAVSKDLGKITMYLKFVINEHMMLISYLRPKPTLPNDYHDLQTLFVTNLAGQLRAEGRARILPIHFKKYMLLSYWIRRRLFEKMCKSGSLTPEDVAAITKEWMNDTEHTWSEDTKRYPDLIHSWDDMTEYGEKVNEANGMLSETATLERNSQQNAESTTYANATACLQAGRKLFVTEGGKMGLGPEKMQLGDSIVLIKGARMD
jgi:hypothetical protein